jgi:hypothetical protein
MAGDSAHELLTPADSDQDGRLGHAPDFDEVGLDLGALHLRDGNVTADDWARASLSDEPDTQCARLDPLFKMCGLFGVGQ